MAADIIVILQKQKEYEKCNPNAKKITKVRKGVYDICGQNTSYFSTT